MQNLGQISAPRRDKYWSEKTTAERVETLADLLAAAHRQIRTLTERLDDLGQHHHQPVTGLLLVPMRDQYATFTNHIGPPGYNHEEFMLGRAPAEHYRMAAPSWPGEAQVEGSLPTAPGQTSPPPEPLVASGQWQSNPLGGLDKPVEMPAEMADPDWPKPAPNPQFHPADR